MCLEHCWPASHLISSLFQACIKASELWCPCLCHNTPRKMLLTVSLSDQSTLCYYSLCSWKAAGAAGAAVTRRKGLSCGMASIAVVLGGLLCSSMEGGKLEKTCVLERGDFFFFFNLENSFIKSKSCFHPTLLQELLHEDKVRSYCCGAGSRETEHSLRIKSRQGARSSTVDFSSLSSPIPTACFGLY